MRDLQLGIIYPDDPDERKPRLLRELSLFLPSYASIDLELQPHPPVDGPRRYDLAYMTRMWGDPALEQLTAQLSRRGANGVAYACTSASFICGVSGAEAQRNRLAEACSVPVTTTSVAVLEALRELKVTRVAVAAPYLDDVADRLRLFLAEAGFEVVSLVNSNQPTDHSTIPANETYAQAVAAVTPDAEGLFISCTGQKIGSYISRLEQELGIPVITSNQATLWHLLCLVEAQSFISGMGQLFSSRETVLMEDSSQ